MGIRVLLCCFLLQNTDYKNLLLFTPFSVTRFAMHRIYAPRGILPVNSNKNLTSKVVKIIFSCVNIHFLV